MKNPFVVSLLVGLAPIFILTILALTQHGHYSYNQLGAIIIWIQVGYVLLLLPTGIILFALKKGKIASGLLTCFGIGLFVSLITFGMGL